MLQVQTVRPVITPGIYRSYTGLVSIVLMLFSVVVMGMVSFFYADVNFLRLGIFLIFSSMALDLAMVQARILKNRMYIAHHMMTMFWAGIGFFYAETLVHINAGVFVYMLLGAMFRRLWKISKDLFPENLNLQWSVHKLMIFFDFCDPLVILLLWDWLMTLNTYHRVFYFGLAFVRLIINARSYPALMEKLEVFKSGKLSTQN